MLIGVIALALILCGGFIYTYFNVINDTRDSVIRNTQDKLSLISSDTTAFLQRAKTVVETSTGVVEEMIEEGNSNEDILNYLLYQTDYRIGTIDERFTGFYGYYRGEYLDGNRWDPYADGGVYYPKSTKFIGGAK